MTEERVSCQFGKEAARERADDAFTEDRDSVGGAAGAVVAAKVEMPFVFVMGEDFKRQPPPIARVGETGLSNLLNISAVAVPVATMTATPSNCTNLILVPVSICRGVGKYVAFGCSWSTKSGASRNFHFGIRFSERCKHSSRRSRKNWTGGMLVIMCLIPSVLLMLAVSC